MKKTLLFALTIALALVCAPVFAEVSISGELDYSAMMNDDETAGEFDKIELDFAADIDDFNSVAIEVEDDIKNNDLEANDVTSSINIDYAVAITDWGGMLGLPFSMTTTIGYEDFYAGDDNYITGWEYEATGGIYMDKEGAVKLSLGFMDGMINPFAAYNFDSNDKLENDGTVNDSTEVLLGLKVAMAPVVANVYYLTASENRPDGEFGVDALVSVPLDEDGMKLDLAGTYDSNLDSDAAEGDEYQWGFGAAYYFSDFEVGASMKGNDDQSTEYLGVEAKYFMNEMLTFAIAPNFYLGDNDDIDTFLGLVFMADVAVNDMFSYRLGYLYSDGYGEACSYTPAYETAAEDGGVFVGCNVNF